MLPVKLKLVSIKNILSRWLHIGCLASHIIFTCWPTQRVGLSHFCFFLLANSTCWPISLLFFFTGQLKVLAYLIHFFYGQLNVLAFYNATRWISSALVSRLPTYSENISWGVGHWRLQETWHHLILRACTHFHAGPDQPCTVHTK